MTPVSRPATRVQVDAVTHRYPGAPADTLQAVTLDVAPGAMQAVVGPSGSGKSTLLRVVAGLEPATEGRILLDEDDMAGVPTEQRDLTMMFQSPLLFDHLDVAGNVAFAPRLRGRRRGAARRDAEEFLRLVHLGGLGRRRVASLSGGQQQRVALARALATRRGVLMLDEPFSSLDRELRTAMHDLLTQVRVDLSPTVLMVTHDLDEAAAADQVAVLVEGRVHQNTTMAALHRRPATLAVARLVGGFGEVDGEVRRGVHHSTWGAVPLDDTCPTEGPATLLLRREALRVEAVTASGDGRPGRPGRPGRVVRRRALGPRTLLDVVADDGARVEVELPPDVEPTADDRVRIVVAPDARAPWALAHDHGTSEGASPDAG